jgi:S-adenosylmethionine-diacylglycerol 3-amino-3-carboxypropyl transferase
MPPDAAGSPFTILRYAQCWEDADVLVDGLDVKPGDVCLSIASAGDNTLSLLTRDPARVIAVDLNPTQIAALELRVAAYRALGHGELLELIGSRPSARREALYGRCRGALSEYARRYWDGRRDAVRAGIGSAGKFERYFALFRRVVLPLVHRRATVRALVEHRDAKDRVSFYAERWNTRAWRTLFRIFFSETVLGRLGRDPSFFAYAEESVADHLMGRVRHALTVLDPAENPYLHWIVTGTHGEALPHALRADSFDAIRDGLDRLEWHCRPMEAVLESAEVERVDRINFSNIFEYMSVDAHRALIGSLLSRLPRGARMAYWNMIVPRSGAALMPDSLARRCESDTLFARDKAFFYRAFHVDEVR